MKVLQIANGFYGNKLYINLFEHLESFGVENLILSPQKKDFDSHNFDYEYAKMKEKVYAPKCFTEVDRFFFFNKERKILKCVIDKYESVINDIDVIHAHTVFSNGYIAYKLNELYDIPYIVAVRNTDLNVFFKYRINLRKIGRKILSNAAKIIFLSEVTREELLSSYIEENDKKKIFKKSETIPNGVNDFWIKNRHKKAKHLNSEKIKLIYVGEINRNKNVKQTIKVCRELIRNGYDINFIVVGRCINKRYRRILNEDFINYHEFCKKEELINYYNEADIFIMPSKKETFGIVYSEALTQGVPVIYTKGQGFDGQFNDGYVGYSVDCNSISDIRNAIIKIINNYDILSNNIINVNNVFDWGLISNRYVSIYQEMKIKDSFNN